MFHMCLHLHEMAIFIFIIYVCVCVWVWDLEWRVLTLPLHGCWESSDEHQRWTASLQALQRKPCLEFPVKISKTLNITHNPVIEGICHKHNTYIYKVWELSFFVFSVETDMNVLPWITCLHVWQLVGLRKTYSWKQWVLTGWVSWAWDEVFEITDREGLTGECDNSERLGLTNGECVGERS